MKVLLTPQPERSGNGMNGISQVVLAWARYLPELGVDLVRDGAPYDLRAVHAGNSSGEGVDVCHCHGLYWTADYQASNWEYQANAEVIANLRHARLITVPSQWVAETIRREMRVDPVVLPHGIEWDSWQGQAESAGYVLWNKNRTGDVCDPTPVDKLAEAFPKTHFMTTFAPRPARNVTITGVLPHDEMRGFVQRAGVYLATTKETFGIGILEAMASGVPVLGFAHGGILDLVEHQVSGYLAAPGNYEDLAAGLDYCQQHRRRLGEAGRAASRPYNWQQVCARVAELYQKLLQPGPTGVTIVIPCYNYANLVGRAMRSVKAQQYTDWECIVVDDGSQDEAAVRAAFESEAAGDQRFRLLRQDNQGVANARNHGIAAGSRPYVCCLDADDEIAPEFLSTLLPALEGDRSLGLAYSALVVVHPDGRLQEPDWPWPCRFDEQVHRRNQVPTCCVFRREIWRRTGGYRQRYAPTGAGAEDAEFWLRIGAYGGGIRMASQKRLFRYHAGGRVGGNPNYQEADWIAWHPWSRDGQHPFASIATPRHASHPVRQYDNPAVSVVVPVGPDHRELLVDALDSLEGQTLRNWECIVVNDSGAPLDLAAYPYAKTINPKSHLGVSAARNLGTQAARAKWIVFLDADDYLKPDFLARHLEIAEKQDKWVYSDCHMALPGKPPQLYPAADYTAEAVLATGLAGVTALYRKQDCLDVGGFDPESTREDWDFHLRLVAAGKCGVRLTEPLWVYRTATGGRREAAGFAAEAKRLREKYTLEALTVACGTCSGRGRVVPRNGGNQVADLKEGETILIEYIGLNSADVTYVGSLGGRYRFGDNPSNKRHVVPVGDAPNLLNQRILRRVPEQAQPAVLASAVAAPIPEPVPAKAELPTEELKAPPTAKGTARVKKGPAPKHAV